MTIRETAKALGLKVRTIREWIVKGKIPAQKVGKYWIIDTDAVNSKEVQERANQSREHSRRIKEHAELGVLAGRGETSKESK